MRIWKIGNWWTGKCNIHGNRTIFCTAEKFETVQDALFLMLEQTLQEV